MKTNYTGTRPFFPQGIFEYQRWMTGWLEVFALLTPTLGSLAFLDNVRTGSGWLQGLSFLGLGIIHLRLLRHREAIYLYKEILSSPAGWTFTLLLTLECLLLSALLYFFTRADKMSMALVNACMFLFPFLVVNAWLVWSSIPEKRYEVWFLPEQQDSFFMPRGKAMGVTLKLKLRYYDLREMPFRLEASGNVRVGRLFANFIRGKERDGMAFLEERADDGQPYGWQFYCPCFGGLMKKFLDGQETLLENDVRDNGVIIARRIKRGTPNNYLTVNPANR